MGRHILYFNRCLIIYLLVLLLDLFYFQIQLLIAEVVVAAKEVLQGFYIGQVCLLSLPLLLICRLLDVEFSLLRERSHLGWDVFLLFSPEELILMRP